MAAIPVTGPVTVAAPEVASRKWRRRSARIETSKVTSEQVEALRVRLARLRLSLHAVSRQQGFSYNHLNALLRGTTRTSIYLGGAHWFERLWAYLDTYEQALEVVRLQAKTAEVLLKRADLPIPETLLPCLYPYDDRPLAAPQKGKRRQTTLRRLKISDLDATSPTVFDDVR